MGYAMFLQLRAHVAYANGAENVVHHVFDTQGGTIGRDPHCQMVLQDPYRRISRIQAQIVFEGAQFRLINASTSNPIYVDEQELNPGAAHAVEAGSCWRTGNYAITVEHIGDAPLPGSGAQPPHHGIQQAPAPLGHQETPVEIAFASEGSQGPFADLLAQPVEPPIAPPSGAAEPDASADTAQHAPATTPASHAQDAPALPASLPDPFSDADEPIPQAPPRPPDTMSLGTDPFADLLAAPLSSQVAAAPYQRQHAGMIPEDFNPLALQGVSARNTADPLGQMDSPASFGDMFAEQTVDASFQPSEGNISELTQDPLNGRQHQGLVDASHTLDPLELFAKQSADAMLNPEAMFQERAGPSPALADHRVEMGAYFRAPRAYDPSPLPPAAETAVLHDPAAAHADEAQTSCPAAPALLERSPGGGNTLEALFDSASSSAGLEAPAVANALHGGSALDGQAPTEERGHCHAPPDQALAIDLRGVLQHPRADTETAAATVPAGATNVNSAPASPSAAEPGSDIPAPSATAQAQAPQPSEQADVAQALLQSFKAGAGLSECRYPEALTPELMHVIGKMLGTSVQGCMDLLGSRAAAKQEVRVSVTLINAEANNPLKFLPTADSALAQIFGPRMPGFQAGPEALVDAFQDLRSHEMAMMAGTQAAVRGLLDRFSPRHFNEQLQALGRNKTLFAAQRQARLWELYCSHYEWLKEEMKNQSPTAWGSEFLSAYQAEAANHHEDHSQ